MAQIGQDIQQAVHYLNRGDLVGIPTETVYGLAANALNPDAVIRIFEVKNRPSFDPLIVHLGDPSSVSDLVREIPEKAKKLMENFWPGPLTLLMEKTEIVPDIVTSGLSTVAVRIPNHPITSALLKSLDFPLAAPSANPFGYISPTTAGHVNDQLGDRIPYILDGGPCEIGIESTIIGFEEDMPVIHRLGGKSIESIRKVVGDLKILEHSSSRPTAPGMLESHYAPRKRVLIGSWENYRDRIPGERTVLLRFSETDPGFPKEKQLILSDRGDLHEAAKNLFASLREFDSLPVDYIIAEPVPDEGLGKAINDRLKRASYRKTK